MRTMCDFCGHRYCICPAGTAALHAEVAALTLKLAGAEAERDDLQRLPPALVGFVPQTYGDAIMAGWIKPEACDGYDWDNRTSAQNARWMLERLIPQVADAQAEIAAYKRLSKEMQSCEIRLRDELAALTLKLAGAEAEKRNPVVDTKLMHGRMVAMEDRVIAANEQLTAAKALANKYADSLRYWVRESLEFEDRPDETIQAAIDDALAPPSSSEAGT